MLKQEFDTDKVPAAIFTKLNRKIKKLTKVNDAFRNRKHLEIETSRLIANKMLKTYKFTLKELLLFSALGNSLDFFKDINHSASQMQKRISFSKDDIILFKRELNKAKKIIFFADNAGELFFDIPLAKLLAKKVKLIYVVKSLPVQNDLTFKELKPYRNIFSYTRILTTGNDAVGIEISTISKTLQRELQKCDLIIAKGMGYYETFTELPQFKGKIFHLLMAKCRPVAKSLGVKLNNYVFLHR